MKYNTSIAKLCERMDKRTENYITLKVHSTYKLEKDGNMLRLYHYGNPVGGVIKCGNRYTACLGSPISDSDVRSLNTMWKYYLTGTRAHLCKEGVRVESINECTDNAVIF